MGFLANTDSSILNVKLEHGFEIKSITDQEGKNLIARLGGMFLGSNFDRFIQCQNYSEKKYYFISNSSDDITVLSKLSNEYLLSLIRIMRIFKEGDIRIALWCYCDMSQSTPQLQAMDCSPAYLSSEPYRLTNNELPELGKFIQTTKLPFEKSYLNLAFNNFELSYEVENISLSFLLLMIGLEILFNPGGNKLQRRLSKNTAILLGKDSADSDSIYKKVSDLYKKRSKLVHHGEVGDINKEDLLKLRSYIRDSIKKINQMNKDKKELLGILNLQGVKMMPDNSGDAIPGSSGGSPAPAG